MSGRDREAKKERVRPPFVESSKSLFRKSKEPPDPGKSSLDKEHCQLNSCSIPELVLKENEAPMMHEKQTELKKSVADTEEMYEPWLLVNRKKRPPTQKPHVQKNPNQNPFTSLSEVPEEDMLGDALPEGKIPSNNIPLKLVEMKEASSVSMENRAKKLGLNNDISNPFFDSSSFKKTKTNNIEEVDFSSSKSNPVSVKVKAGKKLDELHRKMTDTFEIVVSKDFGAIPGLAGHIFGAARGGGRLGGYSSPRPPSSAPAAVLSTPSYTTKSCNNYNLGEPLPLLQVLRPILEQGWRPPQRFHRQRSIRTH
ncbi:hypothetical protein Cni_G28710 [Canna indica]|uniref:Uncharacterized protein n=1 Tax=Canna indica TaxID=4628 RepID=A0AAQ3L374_9LILI|nr:hypothetical protein Cni_G28710 [Canna indica]